MVKLKHSKHFLIYTVTKHINKKTQNSNKPDISMITPKIDTGLSYRRVLILMILGIEISLRLVR